MYLFGAAKALQVCGMVDDPDIKFAGTSAGSLAATGLAAGVDMDELREYAANCAVHCRSRASNAFILRDYVLNGVERYVVRKIEKHPEVIDTINKRVQVYATVLPWMRMKKFENCFEEPRDIGEALAASCCLTPIAGFPFQLRKTREWVCDGGLRAFQPRGGEPNVVTINALYPMINADIRPECYIPLWWGMYPPDDKAYREVYDIAFNDAVSFLVKSGRVDESKLSLLRPVKIATLRGSVKTIGEGNSVMSLGYTFLKDVCVVLFCLLVVRPAVMLLVYGEIVLWGALCVLLALWHEMTHLFWLAFDGLADLVWGKSKATAGADLVGEELSDVDDAASTNSAEAIAPSRRGVSRKRGNRRWVKVYQSVRNLVSLRTMAYLSTLGDKVPINYKRLEKSSRLYRLLRPMVYDRDVADDHHHPETGKKKKENNSHKKLA